MKLPALLLIAATLSLGACASLIQTASVSEAYKHYEQQHYERTLKLINQAEKADALSTETKAELIYLKARTHEKLGKSEIAHTLYQYLAKEHSGSQYGYLAIRKLNPS